MSRIMRRPMFRKGGSAGEGITSGLAPRQGYNTNENNSVQKNDLSKVNLRDANLQQIMEMSKQYGFKAPPMAPTPAPTVLLLIFSSPVYGSVVIQPVNEKTESTTTKSALKNVFLKIFI